jgi:hypothetical protein
VAKTRVHELAKEFGIESKWILEQLKEMGAFIKSASSTVDLPTEMEFRQRLASGKLLPPQTSRLRPNFSATPGIRTATASRPVPPPPPLAADLVRPEPSTQKRDVSEESTHRVAGPGAAASKGSSSGGNARTINVHSLSGESDLRLILRACKAVAGSPDGRRLVFDFEDAKGFYPSISVPAVAIIQHFRDAGVAVEIVNLPSVAEVMRIRNPLEASPGNLSGLNEPLSRVWAYFDHQQANGLTTAFMDCIRRKVECEHGVLEALEWCLYEVLDNVMQHSNVGVGYAMLQLHVRSKRLAVCVSDAGIGVQRSLASSNAYRPRTAFDALTMAVEEGVTRNKKTNQGNGLFGLLKIVEQNGGKLDMRSGRGHMLLEGDRVRGGNDQEFPGPNNHGTTVGFQLKVDKPVSIGTALNYEPANMFLESLESDEGEHVIDIHNQAGGAGSRLAARELKTLIVNVLNEGAGHVVLNFEGQAVVSSSFADEVIGKMFLEMGFNAFNQRIKLRNMNGTVATLVDRAIARRMAQPNS